jgi:hypothetical protein
MRPHVIALNALACLAAAPAQSRSQQPADPAAAQGRTLLEIVSGTSGKCHQPCGAATSSGGQGLGGPPVLASSLPTRTMSVHPASQALMEPLCVVEEYCRTTHQGPARSEKRVLSWTLQTLIGGTIAAPRPRQCGARCTLNGRTAGFPVQPRGPYAAARNWDGLYIPRAGCQA